MVPVVPRYQLVASGVIAVVALGVVWFAAPPQSAPLYDGLCLAAPYKFLGTPPPGETNGGTPGRARKTDVNLAPDSPIELNTDDDDVGPAQAQVVIPAGSLELAAPTTVHAVLEPVPQPSARPGHGYVIGNVYRVAVTGSDGRPIKLRPGASLTLYLLPPKAVPGTAIERLDGGTWTVLPTASTPACTNTVMAASDRTGVFALVDPNPPPASYGGGSGSPLASEGPARTIAVLVGGGLAMLLAAAAVVRLARRRGGRGPDGRV